MIEHSMLETVKQHVAGLSRTVTLVLAPGEHERRDELRAFLADLTSVSEKIVLEERPFAAARGAISFMLEADGRATGIVFSGIPGGHEFSSLILAILQAGGTPLKLDAGIQRLVNNVRQPLHFETFVSLSCHNCPDVVQALDQFALLNEKITSEMIDGGLFQEEVEKRNIQGVPTVYLNGELFINGKVDTAKILTKLLEQYPEIASGAQQEKFSPPQDVTVIGAGPAGAAAAIYAVRKGLSVTIVADRIGGQVKDTLGIENLIGTKKTTGPRLSAELQEHIAAYPITVRENLTVQSLQVGGKTHKIILQTGEVLTTRALIIASGAKWRELGVPGERENLGNGVAYCPHCDGPFFKGKHVAVIGGGNSGLEAALDLAGIVEKVTILEFADRLKADKVLVDAARKRDNITIMTNVATRSIEAENGHVTSLRYQDRGNGEEGEIALAGVFVQIGLLPNTAFLGEALEKTRYGEIIVNAQGETNVPGIFACGDCTTVPYKQIVIAMGEGAKASLSAFDYLIRQ